LFGLLVVSMQVDPHRVPDEHWGTQLFPLHVTEPPLGVEHARQAPPPAPVPHSDVVCCVTHPFESQHPFGQDVESHVPQAPDEQIWPEPQGMP
jgi:hypothetical protein